MEKLIECVINISEGRDLGRIREIAQTLEPVDGAYLLDRSSDPDHHRSVLTFVGSPQGVLEGAIAIFEAAVAAIDLNEHRGVHPRIGAVDVVPFIPLYRAQMSDCVELAELFAREVAARHEVPTFLYGQAAKKAQYRDLANIRRGQFEGLRNSIEFEAEREPDFGPRCLHPTAGACAVGARGYLIAYNIYLDTGELEVGREVARRVRERDGGLPSVKALGLLVRNQGQVQVSINLTNFKVTSLYDVFERVGREALKLDSRISSSEVVGLVPREALAGGDYRRLAIENFSSNLILEERVFEVTGLRC